MNIKKLSCTQVKYSRGKAQKGCYKESNRWRRFLYQLPVTSTCSPSPLGLQPPFSFKRERIKERGIRNKSYSKAQALCQTSFAAAGLKDAACASSRQHQAKTDKINKTGTYTCHAFSPFFNHKPLMFIPVSLLCIIIQKRVFQERWSKMKYLVEGISTNRCGDIKPWRRNMQPHFENI